MTEGRRLRLVTSLGGVAAQDWDRLAKASADPVGETDNPFIRHAFLEALEASGCVSPQTGWAPMHLLAETSDGQLLGAAPCYLKSHSQGEYVFDHSWADAYERAGGRYYPKLQVCVPFTPVPGPRLLAESEDVRAYLAKGLVALRDQVGASSIHVTFAEARDMASLEEHGFLGRMDHQFHWTNAGYASFDDFLDGLASRKRKALKRERRDALAPGITVQQVSGPDLTEAHWDAFFAFYEETGARKWGRPYLNRAFFSLIGERMAERIVLVLALRDGRPIAGALNLRGDMTLYGRYWGAIEHHPFLHFELCYYQAIDYAIAHGLRRVEAGAQGEHKLLRGYLATPTHSAHEIADPGFRAAIADYLRREARAETAIQDELSSAAPFRIGPRTDRSR